MSTCPCCSNRMLRHIRSHQVYWFCRHCWQEVAKADNMPNLCDELPSLSLVVSH